MTVYDPLADAEEAQKEHGQVIVNELPDGPFDTLVLAVPHDAIAELGKDRLSGLLAENGLIYDIKGILPPDQSDVRI